LSDGHLAASKTQEHTMTKRHWFVEIDERWENGCFIRKEIAKPVEYQEAELLLQAMELKELARAQQKLLEPHRNQVKALGLQVRVK
jgi:hypothetical protein